MSYLKARSRKHSLEYLGFRSDSILFVDPVLGDDRHGHIRFRSPSRSLRLRHCRVRSTARADRPVSRFDRRLVVFMIRRTRLWSQKPPNRILGMLQMREGSPPPGMRLHKPSCHGI
jgi:hypothetical protein